MKQSFRKALKIYKYLFLIFTALYWILMPIDDWHFVETYGLRMDYIITWFIWYIVFLIGGSFYYWIPVSAIILFYHKIFLRKRKLPEQ